MSMGENDYITKNDENFILELYPDADIEGLKYLLGYKEGIKTSSLLPLLERTHEAYYWLGMYASDGYISKKGSFVLGLQEKDKDHVYKLAKLLNCNVNMVQNKKTGNIMYRISISDKYNALEIRKMFGITNRLSKTYTTVQFKFMTPGDIKNISFLAGLIDGDGSINKKSKYIVVVCHESWFDSFKSLKSMLPEYIGDKLVITRQSYIYKGKKRFKARIYIDRLTGIKILDHIDKYNLSVIERKWNILRESKITKLIN